MVIVSLVYRVSRSSAFNQIEGKSAKAARKSVCTEQAVDQIIQTHPLKGKDLTVLHPFFTHYFS
jgi:hypothetical protein